MHLSYNNSNIINASKLYLRTTIQSNIHSSRTESKSPDTDHRFTVILFYLHRQLKIISYWTNSQNESNPNFSKSLCSCYSLDPHQISLRASTTSLISASDALTASCAFLCSDSEAARTDTQVIVSFCLS